MRSRRRPGSLWRFGRPPLIERLTRRSDLSSPSSLPPPESRAIPVEMKQDPIANQGVSNAFTAWQVRHIRPVALLTRFNDDRVAHSAHCNPACFHTLFSV